MAIAIGPNVEDGIYIPQTNTILYEGSTTKPATGVSTVKYDAKRTSTAKIEAGGGVAGAPKKRKIGTVMMNKAEIEIMNVFFGGGEI